MDDNGTEPSLLDILRAELRGLKGAGLHHPERLRVLVTPAGWERLIMASYAPPGIVVDGQPPVFQHPGQVGLAMGIPVFVVPSMRHGDIQVQSMAEGYPLDFGLSLDDFDVN